MKRLTLYIQFLSNLLLSL